jgi:hypothetical protein
MENQPINNTYKVSTGTYTKIINNIEYLVIQKYCKATDLLIVCYLDNFNNKFKLT